MHGFAFFHGDDAVFADDFHRFGDKGTDFFIPGGNGSDLLNRFLALNRFGNAFYVFHGRIHGLFNTFFKDNGVRARGEVFKAFSHDRLCEYHRGGGAVAGHVVGFGGNFFHELGAHIFKRIVEFDLFCDRNAVVGDEGCAELLVENDVSALGAEGDFNGIRQYVYARFKCFSCFVSVFDLFSHDFLSP